MKRVAVGLAALAALSIAADRALASGGLSYPMAAHVAAKQAAAHHAAATQKATIHLAGHHRYGHRHRGLYRHPSRHYHPRSVYPRVYGHPHVVVPFPGHPPVVHPPIHRRYYYGPYRHFQYYRPGLSIGIGF